MVGRGGGFGGTERTDVNNCALKSSAGTLFCHFIGGGRENLGDETRAAPGNDVIRPAAGVQDLGVSRRYVNLDAIIDCKSFWGPIFI